MEIWFISTATSQLWSFFLSFFASLFLVSFFPNPCNSVLPNLETVKWPFRFENSGKIPGHNRSIFAFGVQGSEGHENSV